jgi:hypothetical protein
MKPREKEALQFRVGLLGILPMIWRRIVVPAGYTFWDLHVAIQDAMGWTDSHLHAFRVANPETRHQDFIGIPDDEGFDELDTLPGWEIPVQKYLSYDNPLCLYEYDFGDSWLHEVVLEAYLPAPKKLPICLAGERACPPEDVGGTHGYEEFLAVIRDPGHEEHESMLEWVGGSFDPEVFDPKRVSFGSPKERWRMAFDG